MSICEGDENTLWVGTFGGGLNKLNLTTNNFEIYTESEGLSNNNIYGIIEDAKQPFMDKHKFWYIRI